MSMIEREGEREGELKNVSIYLDSFLIFKRLEFYLIKEKSKHQ